ncbi:MAG: hypothetical protein IMY87_06485 [Chloroflexi bacterium]|nr:hypothetical protein [Chloroflexota bacterium]
MENLKPFHSHLEGLQSKTKNLTENGLALNALFAGEETRLKREGEASSLGAVYRAIVERSQRLREIEASASRGHSQANLVLFPVGLIMTAMVSKGKRLSAIADYLLRGPTDSQQPFGLVMVFIGSKGLPDDARVVSISQLARESNRSEPEIMNKLQDDGYLLFSEEAFSLLIDSLVSDIRQGKLHLPLSRDKLVEITGLNKQKLRVKIIEVE